MNFYMVIQICVGASRGIPNSFFSLELLLSHCSCEAGNFGGYPGVGEKGMEIGQIRTL